MADKYTDADRKAMAAKGHAMPDGSYPIADAEDLDNAIHAVGRGGADHGAIRKHIMKRAAALGLSSKIPDNWNADGSLQGATAAGLPLELRRQRRSSMLAIPERISLSFTHGGIEMRAKPNGTGGTAFRFEGYFATFSQPFQMWDPWGDEYVEEVAPGAFTRTLANNADVAFLIGHQDAGILMARTKSGTMTLSQDSHGGHCVVPAMDGSREDVRALASAVERGDMDEMSCAFVTRQQRWDENFERRTMLEMDLNRGDVSAVVFGANPHTAGSSMVALPVESLTLRRPVSARMPEQRAGFQTDQTDGPDYDPQPHADQAGQLVCPHGSCTDDRCAAGGSGSVACNGACPVTGGAPNSPDSRFCDQCGGSLYSQDGTIILGDSGVPEEIEGDAAMALARNAALELRRRRLELIKVSA